MYQRIGKLHILAPFFVVPFTSHKLLHLVLSDAMFRRDGLDPVILLCK